MQNMTLMKSNTLRMATTILTLFAGALPLQAACQPAAHTPSRISVAVLPLAPADTYLPLPSPSELRALTRQLLTGMADFRAIALSRSSEVDQALARLGYQQASLVRSCVDSYCAHKIGAVAHTRVVVFGAVTRLMAVIWSTEIHIIDVHSGRELGQISGGYKGDYNSMERGERAIGAAAARLITSKARANSTAEKSSLR
jgi:hypothetical protein